MGSQSESPERDRKRSSRSKDEKRKSRKDDKDDDGSLSEGKKSSRRRDRKRDDRKRKKREESDSSESEDEKEKRRDRDRRHRRSKSSKKKRRRREEEKKRRKKKKKKYSSSSESESSDSSSESSSDEDRRTTKKVVNKKLLAKLAAKGETLEEWRERKSNKRAARITAKFGYTADDNPFNDPNLHETFTWKKKEEKTALNNDGKDKKFNKADHVFHEIEKVRKRREDRDAQFAELERIRAEESRMKELEHYDEWARKEEEFHLAQQRQRSAIRLVEGREKPIDVLAKNLLLFGLSDEDRDSRGSVKYQERYNALNALEALEAELEEPQNLLKVLKLNELEELLVDIQAFMSLEREASAGHAALQNDSTNAVLKYWEALKVVAEDEIKYLNTGGADGSHAKTVVDVHKIFEGQSADALTKMKGEVEQKLRNNAVSGTGFGAQESEDRGYWMLVLDQLTVNLSKMELSELHSKMLVCQLEKLEQKKEELSKRTSEAGAKKDNGADNNDDEGDDGRMAAPKNVAPDFGDLEEELGLTDEIDVHAKGYSWQDKYRPRKPRYFNRVKTGYDWNKYNQTHYDHDNPPPKIVQGYKFNVFYPDLIDPTKTPQFFLEPADSDEFCILRFNAGPPYEDVAFKIINREWNRSRKRGFRCTFERGVLSLYFNFTTHWYRR